MYFSMRDGCEAGELSRLQKLRNASLLGARLRGRTATQQSKKGSEKALGRVLEKGSQ